MNRRAAAFLAATVATVLMGAMGWALVAQQRRIDRLEALVTTSRPSPPAPVPDGPPEVVRTSAVLLPTGAAAKASTSGTPASPTGPSTVAASAVPFPDVSPTNPTVRAFAASHRLDGIHWRTLRRLNEWWVDSLRKAEQQGESSLPDKLAFMAQQRRIKLNAVLGEQGAKDWDALEQNLDGRITVHGRDGATYEAAAIE
jgi:hypothetical protein